MAASVVTRSNWTDDPGTGLVGTIINNNELQKIYDNIDLMFSGTGSYTVAEFGGGVKIDGVLDIGAGYKETLTALGNVSTGTVPFNLALGSAWTMRLTAAAGTTTLSNVPASGRFGSFIVRVEGDGTARAWTWFDSTVHWDSGVPVRTSTNGKFDWYLFVTVNGGSAWAGFALGQNMDA
jgi:hypothetical protein